MVSENPMHAKRDVCFEVHFALGIPQIGFQPHMH